MSLTQSCTDALEVAAELIKLKPGDEVIMPSYTFTSTANSVVLKGAKPVFADINKNDLQIDDRKIESLITKKTKAVFVVHYGGNCKNLNNIIKLKRKYKFFIVEDTAHSFLASYKNKMAGTIGDIGVFSFHETKNFIGGQGGAISINNNSLQKRVNFLLDKGTDRINFLKNYRKQFIAEKKTSKKKYYSWVDIGSEYRASELSSALIYSQLQRSNELIKKKKKFGINIIIFLKDLKSNEIEFLSIDKNVKSAFHLFSFKMKTKKLASKLRAYLQKNNVPATFHYVPLHSSKFGKQFKHGNMNITDNIWMKIIRLPIYPDLKNSELNKINNLLKLFLNNYLFLFINF